MKRFINSIRVGIFLGLRQVRRASLWTTLLITIIMTLTFLNLVFVSGILVGLIEGAITDYRAHYSGDVLLTNLPTKNYIIQSPRVIDLANSFEEVEVVTGRQIEAATVEANYRTKTRPSDRHDSIGVNLVGIDPVIENKTTQISDSLIKGEFLEEGDEEYVLLGHYLLSQYSTVNFPGEDTLDNVDVGTKVKVIINGNEKELTVKGVLKSKVDEVSIRAFVVDSLMRKLSGRTDYNVNEIAVRLEEGRDPAVVKEAFARSGIGEKAHMETYEESLGEFFKDVTLTFSLLGTFLGSIGLVVASITVFIVIFINAITRRKFIGIMKGIGISTLSIEVSYVIQSILYAIVGSAIGVLIVYYIAVPYFQANPIDFPFSDGILVAPRNETMIKVGLIIIATIIAGYLPAKLVTRGNTLEAILGR